MMIGDDFEKRTASQKSHRIERLAIFLASGEFVNGHDIGVLELPGDLRLAKESAEDVGSIRRVGSDLLEGNLAVQVAIPGDPDLTKTPFGMEPEKGVTVRLRPTESTGLGRFVVGDQGFDPIDYGREVGSLRLGRRVFAAFHEARSSALGVGGVTWNSAR